MSDPAKTDPLDQVVVELVLAIGLLRRRLRSEVDPAQLSLSQISVLMRLEQNELMTTAELARAESMKPQSMGAILGQLTELGLVQRRPHPTDGRQVQFQLTAEGKGYSQARRHAKHSWLLSAVAELPEKDQQRLVVAASLIKRLAES